MRAKKGEIRLTKIKYPTVVIEDFFDTPDLVAIYAKQQSYAKAPEGEFPGARTTFINELDMKIANELTTKTLPVMLGTDYFSNDIEIKFDAYFQSIERFSDDANDLSNKGFIHTDWNYDFAGIIYLNEYAHKRCGTSIYKYISKDEHYSTDIKGALYKDGQKLPEFDEEFTKYNSQFEETVSVDYRFNRCMMFDSNQFHGVNNFHTDTDEQRLTLVFFCKVVKNNYNRGNQ